MPKVSIACSGKKLNDYVREFGNDVYSTDGSVRLYFAKSSQSILTKWGTWISTVLYCTSNLDKLEEIINSLDDSDSFAIRIVEELLQDKTLSNDPAFIASNYANLPEAINALEKRNMPLVDALKFFESITVNLTKVPGEKGTFVREICERVVAGNKDLEKMKNIGRVLKEENDADVTEMDPQTGML